MPNFQRISPFLWFDSQAEEAAKFYVGSFKNSKLGKVSRYTEAGQEIHGRKPGSVMTIDFELEGQQYTAINGGPMFKFTEAISFMVHCDNQEEVDYYWDKLTQDSDPQTHQCGWLKDKFGVSWQVVPKQLFELMNDPDRAKAARATQAMLQMKKLDIEKMKQAAAG